MNRNIYALIILTIVALALTWFLVALPADAGDIDVSVGCLDEVTGEPGLEMATGECVTPAEYDAMFSTEALRDVESQTQPGRSVADVYRLTDDIASQRPRSFMGETLLPFSDLVFVTAQGQVMM